MKRAFFIVIGVIVIVLFKSQMPRRMPQESVSNQMVQYQGKTYRAVMARHGDTLEKVVLIEGSGLPSLSLNRDRSGGYTVSYAGTTGPREESMSSGVAVLDESRGLQSVILPGTLKEIGERIRNKQPLDSR